MIKHYIRIIVLIFLPVLNMGFRASPSYVYSLPIAFTYSGDDTIPIPLGDTCVCTIHFKRAGNLILIEAQADTVKGDFILDTGAPYLVLNNTYFRDHSVVDTIQSGGINGGISNVTKTIIQVFSIGAFKYQHISADMISLKHIEDLKGQKILGLIGLNMLVNYTISIDYTTNVIKFRLLKPKEGFSFCKKQGEKSGNYQTVKFKLIENKIITVGKMSGEKLNFIIDTGAETNILDSRLSNNVLAKVTLQGRVNLGGSDANKVEAVNGEAEEIKLGTCTVQHLPVTITNLNSMCDAYGFCIHGMLGYGFLSLHHVEINFSNGEMYLWD